MVFVDSLMDSFIEHILIELAYVPGTMLAAGGENDEAYRHPPFLNRACGLLRVGKRFL